MDTLSSEVQYQLLESDIDAIRLIRLVNYVMVAATTFLIYDVILNLDDEIKHIWRSKWSIATVMYICIRYYGIAYLSGMFVMSSINMPSSYEMCQRYFAWITLGGPVIFATISNVILMLRVDALYNKNRYVLIFLGSLTFAQFIVALYMAVQLLTMNLQLSFPTDPQTRTLILLGCHAYSANISKEYLLVSEITLLALATVFFLMTGANLINISRAEMRQVSPFLTAFVRDCAIYYFAHMVMLVVVVVISVVVKGLLLMLCLILSVPTFSFSTSRLILNPRVMAERQRRKCVRWRETPTYAWSVRTTTDHDHSVDRRNEECVDLPIELRLLQ